MERIWVYQANRIMSGDEKVAILEKLKTFTSQWKAHGKPLAASVEVRYGLFIVLAIDQSVEMPSGCSIDKSVHLLKELERELGIDLFDRMQIAYRVGGQIEVLPRERFEAKIAEGEITPETVVFNNLVSNRKELEESWEVPFKESWHAKVFELS